MIILLAFASCRKGSMWGIKGQGNNIAEVRDINGFSGINSSIDADISYINDSVYKVEVIAQKNILLVLETKIEGGDLCIDFKRNVCEHNKVSLIVHSPTLKRIKINGSGNMNVQNALTTSDLELKVSGSGNISVPTVSVQNLTARVSGSGWIKVNSGNVSNEHFSVSGSGSIKAEFVLGKTAEANISGSGDVYLSTSDRLSVNISGSGNVKYHGTPKIDLQISGSGKVINLD